MADVEPERFREGWVQPPSEEVKGGVDRTKRPRERGALENMLRAETLHPHIHHLTRPRASNMECFRTREGLHRMERACRHADAGKKT